jgi:CPA2 family monovalent cation:H+ antiporter-2
VFSVIIITLILLSTQYLTPLFEEYKWTKIITAIVTLVLLSPFLWALAFRRTHREEYAKVWVKYSLRGPLIALLILRIVLAVFYIGFLFDRLFSPTVALFGAFTTSLILLVFYRKIKSFYGKIELQFLNNLNQRNGQPGEKTLAPWDTHFSVFELKAESPFIGKTLKDSRIREKFGINIARIKRGNITINVPGRNERLYPNDTLSVIGTDRQLKVFKDYLEENAADLQDLLQAPKISLQNFKIGKNSALVGQSIRKSGIRELSKGLVVGIERRGTRILNPESDAVFEMGDVVWVVGNEKRIQVLAKDSE